MKKCKKCGIEKELSEFYKKKNGKYGVHGQCKVCMNDYKKTYYEVNKMEINEKKKAYYEENKEKIKYNQKSYYNSNKEKRKVYHEAYREANKEKIREQSKSYQISRLKTSPLYRLTLNYRRRIKLALEDKGFTKKGSSKDLLGCEYQELLDHLNNNPYGFVYGEGDYDVDHIIPCATATTEEELLKLQHYTNLQLLPSEYNQSIKKDKPWDREHFENWLESNKH